MKHPLNNTDRRVILRIVAIYAIFSGLWIYLSDTVLGLLIRDRAALVRISVFKGLLFILLTSYLLYQLIARHIRASRQADQALRESEERYRQLVEHSPDAIFVHNGSEFMFANNAALRFFGAATPEQLLGKPVLDFAHPDSREMVNERIRHLLELRTAVPLREMRVIRLDGTVIDAETVGTPIIYQGKPAVQAVIRDITRRKRMEAELRESEKRLNKAQEIAHLGSWELDVGSNVLTWSDEVYRIFGLKPQEFSATYEAFLEAVHPDDREAVDAAYSRSLREGRDTYDIEHRVVHKSTGEIRYVHEKCEHTRDETGKVIRSVGMVQDITESKKVQESQQESDRRYRSLFENMLDGFAYCKMLFDDQGRPEDFVYLDVNSAFSRLTGLDNVVGRKATEAIPGIKELHPELFEMYGQVALTGRPVSFEFELKPLDMWLFVAVYSTQRGYFVAVFDNITERKQAAEELKKANEELETRVTRRTMELEESRRDLERQNEELRETYHKLEVETAERIRAMGELREKDQLLIQQSRMAAMGEMLGNIAHQWRQPLNVLGLKVQEVGLCFELGGFSKKLLDDNIAKSMEILQHLSQTIDDFRDVTTPDREKILFRVNQVVGKTLSLIEDSFRELGVAIEVRSSGEPQINGYPNEYSQVLFNVLMNARDAFLEHETNDARVTVRSWTEEGRAVVTVTDNAGGIKEEIRDKIFDAYFTTKELGKGTGIGLFMAKNIIEKNMGGRLTVRNVDGGAQFKIEV